MAVGTDLQERIARYIDDAIALEAAAETSLKDMISDATEPEDAALFQEHLTQTATQKARLEARLKALGGEHSHNVLKDLMNKVGAVATDLLHAGKDSVDKAARNMIQAYAVENLEVATYMALAAAATEAGDAETATLAKTIQAEEEAAAKKVYARIAPLSMAAIKHGIGS